VGALVLALTLLASSAPALPAPVVVATGLNSPRHLTFSDTGDLYVAEAGRGGPRPGAPGANCHDHPGGLGVFCLGFTGRVTLVNDNGPEEAVLTGLPSISNGTDPVGPEALGPSDIAVTGRQTFVMSIGLGSSDTYRASFGPAGALLATLVSGKLKDDRVTLFADVLAYEAAANPDGTDIDSNPTGIVRDGDGYVLTDSGGNAVVRASHKGVFTTITPVPPTPIGADAVPTSVVRGPDNAFYFSQLTGFPFQPGAANVWRVVPGRAPTVYASGLTNVTDLAWGPDGSLYAVQIAANGLLNGPIGSLVKVAAGSGPHQTVIGGLFAPYGVAFGNGSAYVSTCTVCAGGGQVLKIPLS
jgi:hypothetical protein